MDPILVHVHVPKCGGTSFRNFLDASFSGRHRNLYVDRTSFIYSPRLLEETVLRDGGISSISSHFIRTFPRLLAGHVALYVTFLRDPVRHFLSYMTYIKKVFAGIRDEELLRHVPRDAADMSLRDFAEWILTRPGDIPFKENYTVNFFAEHAWSEGSGYVRPPCEYGTGRWDPVQFDRYKAVRLDLARVILDSFFFVGIVEHMEVSVRVFRERCRAAGLDLCDAPLKHENVSSDLLDDLVWLHPGDRVGNLLFDSIREDLVLYRRFRTRCCEEAFGPTPPAVKYDRKYVHGNRKQSAAVVYYVVDGMRRLVLDPQEQLTAALELGGAVTEIDQWEIDEIPPGAPLQIGSGHDLNLGTY